jgi:hypothetical protein
MKNHPTDYHLSAGQCRRRADAAANEVSKATWLRFAKEWLKLGDEAEQGSAPAASRQPLAGSRSALG